jgi:5-methylcytosine-specific restriction endonuclease McrA
VTYCPAHAPEVKPWARKNFVPLITGWEWAALKLRVQRRDGHTCALCGGSGDEVDHVVPRSEGGTDDPDNLRVLCAPCHKVKSDRERKAGYRRRWKAARRH